MKRRAFLFAGLGLPLTPSLFAALRASRWDAATDVLEKATASDQIRAAALCVRHKSEVFTRSFGQAKSVDDLFLIASISKTMTAAALMTLYDRGKFRLDDPAVKYIPEFTGGGRETITVQQLLTHDSGLPDQLPENAMLRARHAKLSEFVKAAIKTPLLFKPGTRYQYSSMAILLAAEIAQRLSKTSIHELMDKSVFQPLEMKHSALGLGRFKLEDLMPCQVEKAAPESGAGDPAAKDWDWNSRYWRALGAPWGSVHSSAPDVARFFAEFLHPQGKMLKPETAKLMIRNHNPKGIRPRGLGFDIGAQSGGRGCSERTFGHSGSTGTLAWADPATDTVCVVLTTLPGRAASPHPRTMASDLVAAAASSQP